MMQYWSHFKYTIIHKYFVFLECCKRGIVWRGIMHDMSKFSPSEFGAYANYFFYPNGTRKDNPQNGDFYQTEAFKHAWCHHIHSNDHHWNHHLITEYHGTNKVSPVMPKTDSIKEMAADMIGANIAQGGTGSLGARNFYLMKSDSIILSPSARYLLEYELGIKSEEKL
jgi:hypothetical protein